jgi:hypothetical protein
MKKTIGIILLLVFAWVRAFSASCTPTSVQVCGIADDFETIYIGGEMVGAGNQFRFVHINCPGTMDPWSVCPTPVCVSYTPSAAVINAISTTGKITLAVQVSNAKGNDVFGSWYVDVTCSSGKHAYIASDGVSTIMFSTTGTGNAGTSSPYLPSCAPVTVPPVTSGNWYDANPALGTEWSPAVVVVPANLTEDSGQIWSKQISNPATGLLIPVLSVDSSAGETSLGHDACALLYFSQTVPLTIIDPPPPPSLTLTKSLVSANPVSTTCAPMPCYAASAPVTWAMQICNSGGPITTGAVSVVDDNADFMGGSLFAVQTVRGKYAAFNNAMDLTNADEEGVAGTWQSGGITYVFLKGMQGANFSAGTTVPYCYSVTAVAWDYALFPSELCTTRTNNFRTTSGVVATSNTLTVSIMCPPTSTQTLTPTMTPTTDLTIVYTPATNTPTRTFTATPTRTGTSTSTFTPTNTSTPSGATSGCNPISVQVCGVADDTMSLWINGVSVGASDAFQYVHIDCPNHTPVNYETCTTVCVSLTSAEIASANFTDTGNVIAARVQNYQGHRVFGSYWVDVTCSGGVSHAYIQSSTVNSTLWDIAEGGSMPSCNSLPPDGLANWYSTSVTLTGGIAPVAVTSGLYSRPILNPLTGLPIPVLSLDSAGGSGSFGETQCNNLYIRQTFSLTPVGPIPSPTIVITKSIIGGTGSVPSLLGEGQNSSDNWVTFGINYCNDGGPVAGGVTLFDDTLPNQDSKWTHIVITGASGYTGQPSKGFGTAGADGQYYEWDSAARVMYPGGFLGANFSSGVGVPVCRNVTVACQRDQIDYNNAPYNGACSTWTNYARFAGAMAVTSNSVTITSVCKPTETYTPTITATPTWTVTGTPTPTQTIAVSFTVTGTPIPTMTATPTQTTTTPTSTKTATFTVTPSRTWTATPTPSSTDTFTATKTLTPTATESFTSTPTASATQTWTWSVSVTSTPTPTASFTLTPTETPVITLGTTATPTGTLVPWGHDDGHQNTFIYPSPARGPYATVAYKLKEPGRVRIRVWNAAAEWVAEVNEYKASGPQTSILTVRDYAPGVYLYRVLIDYNSGGHEQLSTVRFVVLR